jgi:alcohol dehydrogenase
MKTRSLVLSDFARPKPYSVSQPLQLEELELERPGPGEVLVQLAAAGLCHSDLSVINGTRRWPLPLVLGHEASGIVRECGPGVHDLKPDDHVVFSFLPVCGRCAMCVSGRASLCERGVAGNRAGVLLSGERRFQRSDCCKVHHHSGVAAFSEFTVAARESLVKIDNNVPLEIAVLFGCAIMTGVGAVVNTARVAAGTSVAVFGLGGVGLAAVLGARVAGAWPIIAVDRIPSKLDLARKCGATHTINVTETDPVSALRDLTSGGVETAFEAVGCEQVMAQAFAATRRGGKTVAIGLADPTREVRISAVTLVGEERQLLGSYMGSCVPQRDIPRFLNMYRAGILPVELLKTREIHLEDVNAAFDALDDGSAVRQVIRF